MDATQQEQKIQQIQASIQAGTTVLVLGEYGSGKFFMTQEAFRRRGSPAQVLPGDYVEEPALSRILADSQDLIVAGCDKIPPGRVADLVRFLTSSTQAVALLANSREGVHPDLLAHVHATVQV